MHTLHVCKASTSKQRRVNLTSNRDRCVFRSGSEGWLQQREAGKGACVGSCAARVKGEDLVGRGLERRRSKIGACSRSGGGEKQKLRGESSKGSRSGGRVKQVELKAVDLRGSDHPELQHESKSQSRNLQRNSEEVEDEPCCS